MEKLRLGIVGVGKRGTSLMKLFLKMDQVQVVAVCDLYQDRVDAASEEVVNQGFEKPFGTTDYKELVTKDKVDCIVVTTSWRTRVEVVTYSMKQGVPVGSEVGGANSLEDCFELVRVWEETKTPYMFCENCNYGERELMVLNMVKKGLFGDIVHCEGGYCHDLREEIGTGREKRHYRIDEYLNYNRENYPSHELGPIMNVLDINRSNRLVSLASFSSKSMGMNAWAKEKSDKKELQDAKFNQGDVVTTVITCANGETIVLTLDTTLPRAYSRKFTVRGTKGMYMEDNDSVFLDSKNALQHDAAAWREEWGNAKTYAEGEYAHPLWANITDEDREKGHGGMDYLCYSDFFNHVISGEPMPIDVYDGATIMAISPLSEISIKSGSIPVAIPDFKKR